MKRVHFSRTRREVFVMNFAKVAKKAKKLYSVEVSVQETERSVVLSGRCDNWQTIVDVGKMFVNHSGKHVVNDVLYTGADTVAEQLPQTKDEKLQGTQWDVVIVGGGISGCSVARELSRYDLKILLCEKHSDVARGASGANDGMVHAGIDLKHPCKKLHYVVKGNAMYADVCKDLGVDFVREGQYVVFSSRLVKFLARSYLARAKKHNIPGVSIISKQEICALEPCVKDFAKGALKIPSTGAVSPYKLTVAYAENAVQNGVTVSLNTAVLGMKVQEGNVVEVQTNRGAVKAKCVIN